LFKQAFVEKMLRTPGNYRYQLKGGVFIKGRYGRYNPTTKTYDFKIDEERDILEMISELAVMLASEDSSDQTKDSIRTYNIAHETYTTAISNNQMFSWANQADRALCLMSYKALLARSGYMFDDNDLYYIAVQDKMVIVRVNTDETNSQVTEGVKEPIRVFVDLADNSTTKQIIYLAFSEKKQHYNIFLNSAMTKWVKNNQGTPMMKELYNRTQQSAHTSAMVPTTEQLEYCVLSAQSLGICSDTPPMSEATTSACLFARMTL
jgi:hypothetical protein